MTPDQEPTTALSVTIQEMVRRLADHELKMDDLTPDHVRIVAQWYSLEKIDLLKEVEGFFAQPRSPSTVRAYRSALTKLLTWCAQQPIHPLQLTPDQADEYALELRQGAASNASVRLAISGASTWYSWIERRHGWLKNPFRGTRTRPSRVASKSLAIPSDQEISVIFQALSEAVLDLDAAFIAVLCFRGLRVSGAAQIRLKASDFRTISRGKELHGELPAQTLEYLRKAGLRTGLVFAQRTTEGWRNRVSYLMRSLHDRGLIKAPYSAHDFRHYYALSQYRADHDIQRLRHLLGHASISVTEEYLRGLSQL